MAEIRLTDGQIAYVDDEDFALISQYRWCPVKQHNVTYAHSRDGRQIIKMHHLVLRPEKGLETHHIDGDGLNNRRSNLRNVTHAVNIRNQVHRKPRNHAQGTCFVKRVNRWRAYVHRGNRSIHLGYFATEEEGAKAYTDFLAAEILAEEAKSA